MIKKENNSLMPIGVTLMVAVVLALSLVLMLINVRRYGLTASNIVSFVLVFMLGICLAYVYSMLVSSYKENALGPDESEYFHTTESLEGKKLIIASNRKLRLLGSVLLSLLLATGLQVLFFALFTFRSIDFYNFNGVQSAVEIVYLAVAVILGTGIQISSDKNYIYVNKKSYPNDEELDGLLGIDDNTYRKAAVSISKMYRASETDLETALGYIALLEDHIKYNDDFHNDNYLEYSQTELELQIREFRTKKEIISLIKDGVNPQSRMQN